MTEALQNPGATPASHTSTGTRLSGNLGATSLVLSVLAFSAPIVTVSGYIAFAIGFVGQQAPLAWVIATIGLTIFAIGYTTMTRHIRRPGAFYAYISVGLGKTLGVGGAYLASISYMLITVGIYTFSGVSISAAVEHMDGPSIPWWVCTAAGWIVITVLGHFQIELSARVLGTVMVLEVILVAVFNVFVLAKGGAQGLSAEPLNPTKFFNGGTGLALLFAFGNFIGFEATALYRDEVRDPRRTIPRATYAAVFLIGGFYAISAYSLITAYGSAAPGRATDDPTSMFDGAMATYVSSSLATITLVLVATSALASVLSTHNVVARYLQNLGADHAAPTYLAGVHPVHKSPYRASAATSGIVGVLLILAALFVSDETKVIGAGSGIGTAGVLTLMALVSFSVYRYFARVGRPADETAWRVVIAPLIAFVILSAVVIFAIVRFDLLVGGEPGQNLWMLLILVVFLLAGCGVALHMKRNRPELFARLGRAEGDDVATDPTEHPVAP
ncbi:APC family permease [Gordonia polyisoprenivorans]|uniref:APC family permease n=1 Tax=Gordonia polyisoprenivorans TaxID=84595 RepID=UPI0019F076E3|nr:APC family permease [Gordonia polyisoprenivorans]MBE7191115.1 APC family permease [Gordonia polyisoprenivorans]QUD83593.1 APC family permease [Gordonia polyisoprenivorans]UZF55445.1 APC family permease [Gordonia polyisoprenivorans]